MDLAEQIVSKANKKPVPFVLNTEKLYKKINNNPDLKNDLGTPYKREALFLAYLTGARASELLRVKPMDFEGHGDNVTVLLLNEKKRRGAIYRKIPLRTKHKYDGLMLKRVTWLVNKQILNGKEKEPLWPVTRSTLWRWAQKINLVTQATNERERKIIDVYEFRMFPHYLRHCRATHFVNIFRVDAFTLQGLMGWTSPEMARVYVKFDWKTAADLLLGRWKGSTE